MGWKVGMERKKEREEKQTGRERKSSETDWKKMERNTK